MKELKFKVDGMHCEGCENRIKKALNMLNAVTDVYANFKDGIVIVTIDKNVNTNSIKETINDLGFEIKDN